MMNPWLDFFVTLLIRVVVCAPVGFLIAIGLWWRLHWYFQPGTISDLEVGLIGAGVGTIAAIFTIPREHRPWV